MNVLHVKKDVQDVLRKTQRFVQAVLMELIYRILLVKIALMDVKLAVQQSIA